MYKEPDVAIRTKLINNIINLENKINDYNKYIDSTVKVSIRFKSELIILITFFISFIFAFLIYLFFFALLGFGGGMLTPCADKLKCTWV